MWYPGRKRESELLGHAAAKGSVAGTACAAFIASPSDASTRSPSSAPSLVLAGLLCVWAGCGSDVHPADRAAGTALRKAGARLELDGSGKVTGVILSDTPVDDGQLECLGALDSVRFLRLESTGITDSGLQYVQGMGSLEEISLYRTHVTSAGAAVLGGLTNLKSLGLNETEINDTGLKHLAALNNLEHL